MDEAVKTGQMDDRKPSIPTADPGSNFRWSSIPIALVAWGVGIWPRTSQGQPLPDASRDSFIAAACYFEVWWILHRLTRRKYPPTLILMALLMGDGVRPYSIPRRIAIGLIAGSLIVVIHFLCNLPLARRAQKESAAEPPARTDPVPEGGGR